MAPARAFEQVGQAAHGFGSADQETASPAEGNPFGGHRNCLQTGSTGLVDGYGGDFGAVLFAQCAEGHLPGDVGAGTGLPPAAEDDLVNLCSEAAVL